MLFIIKKLLDDVIEIEDYNWNWKFGWFELLTPLLNVQAFIVSLVCISNSKQVSKKLIFYLLSCKINWKRILERAITVTEELNNKVSMRSRISIKLKFQYFSI